MTKQHSDKSTSRDDADARGEHQYPDDATRPKRKVVAPFERNPEHYAAGANGTQQVTATPSSGRPAGTDAKAGLPRRDAEQGTGSGDSEQR
jgi:hypothetical protein